MNLIAVYS